MLQRLKIKNIALISESVIDFDNSLNILSGETGAGKSLVIDSLNFVLGARADKTLIKNGEEYASVEAVFYVDTIVDEIKEFFDSIGADAEQTIIITRYLNVSGKTDIHVNGQTVTNSMLKKLTTLLVDIHGQHSHQALLDPQNHIGILDNFDIKSTLPLKKKLSEQIGVLKDIDSQISSIGGLGEERERNIELLKYQIDEITNAKLSENEEEQLSKKRTLLQNSEKISQSLSDTTQVLSKGEFNSLIQLKTALNDLKPATVYDKDLQSSFEKLQNIYYDLLDESEKVYDKQQSLFYDEDELNNIETRLDEIKQLKRKYGSSVSEILNYLHKSEQSLDDLLHAEEKLNELQSHRNDELGKIYTTCNELTSVRKTISSNIEKQIEKHLLDLGIKHPDFKVVFLNSYSKADIEKYAGLNGADDIEFMFSANLGEPVKPLSKIISGGEMSRFMLAIKCVLNENSNKTFVFDEIDNGIGGLTGTTVAQKLSAISKHNQIICITHLAQIASFADTHFYISKHEENGKTKTVVALLDNDGKEKEIARLLGSESNSTVGLMHAKELLQNAQNFKNKLNN